MPRLPYVGTADDFTQESDEIKRRKLQLEKLLEPDPGANGWGGVAAALVKNLGYGYAGGKLDVQEKDLASRRADFARQAIENVPQPTPAQPEVNPSAPLAGEEGPPLPTNYAPPVEPGGGMVPQPPTYEHKNATPFLPTSPADWAKYGAKYGSVSPFIGGIAATGFKEATELPAKQEAARLAAQEKRDLAREAQVARAQERELTRIETARLAENAAADRRADQEARAADRRADQDARAADRSALAGVAAASGGGTFSPAGSTLEGNPVHVNTKTLQQVEMRNGVPTLYTGPVVSKGEEKEVKAAMDLANDARYAESLAKAIAADPKTFGPQANFGTSISSFFGGLGKEQLTGLTPEQLALRGVIGRDFAETTKQLYGASFSQSEQKRANTFTPQSNDSAEVVMQKLNGASSFSREMAQKYGSKIQQAAAARSGAPAAATPIRAQDANGKWWRKYPDGRVEPE